MLKAGSLFSGGIDGFGIAFSLAGVDIRWHVEIDPYNRELLKTHDSLWKNAAIHADVRDCGSHNLEPVDILFGGFPCQDISVSGKRAGMGKGTRSGLWSEFRRIIEELRPRIVLIENTPGLLAPIRRKKLALRAGRSPFIHRADVRRTVAVPPLFEVTRQLAAMGYMGSWGTISAADAGAPHLRERVFILGYAVSVGRQGQSAVSESASNEERNAKTPQREGRTVLHATEPNRAVLVNARSSGRKERHAPRVAGDAGHIARRSHPVGNAVSQRRKRTESQASRRSRAAILAGRSGRNRGENHESRLGGYPDGITPRLDGFTAFPNPPGEQAWHEPSRVRSKQNETPEQRKQRAARLRANGNGIVWQVAYPLAWHITQLLTER